jgi:hypothetical protein
MTDSVSQVSHLDIDVVGSNGSFEPVPEVFVRIRF